MIRITSPSSVCATTRNLPLLDKPKVRKRASPREWSGSEPVTASVSRKAVHASANETPCLRALAAAFLASVQDLSDHREGQSRLACRFGGTGEVGQAAACEKRLDDPIDLFGGLGAGLAGGDEEG